MSAVRELGHFIAGARVAGAGGRCSEVFDPATGTVTARVALAGRAQTEQAIAAAAARPHLGLVDPSVRGT